MDIEKIKSANTKYIGKKIEYYEEIESTHIYAKKIAKDIENDGKIILAEVQTAGIGTKGRSWYTGNKKNIAMTTIVHTNKNANELEGITIKIATCIKQAIKELYGYNLEIKEPNDLMLNGKKICGILTQIQTQGDKIRYMLISYGFNVNEDRFSKETRELATSLKNEYKKEFEREEIIKKIIEKFEEIEL